MKKKRDKIFVKELEYFMGYKDSDPQWWKEESEWLFKVWIDDKIKCGEAKKIAPIFNNKKQFYNRTTNKYWIETAFGAYELTDPKQFLWELHFSGEPTLNITERKAIEFLISHGILGKKFKRILWNERNRRDLREIHREKYRDILHKKE